MWFTGLRSRLGGVYLSEMKANVVCFRFLRMEGAASFVPVLAFQQSNAIYIIDSGNRECKILKFIANSRTLPEPSLKPYTRKNLFLIEAS